MTTIPEQARKRSALAASPLFAQLDSRELDSLEACTSIRRLRAREAAFLQGSGGSQMFAIASGRAKISAVSEDGKEVIFSFLDAGDVFGEISLLDGQARTATVTAVEPTELIVLDRRDFLPLLQQQPGIAVKLLAVLCRRLRDIDEFVEDVLFLDCPSRLAKKLIALGRAHGHQTAKGLRIDLRLSQQELGQLVGTSRESINKQLRCWEDEGLIATDRTGLTLHDVERLERQYAARWQR